MRYGLWLNLRERLLAFNFLTAAKGGIAASLDEGTPMEQPFELLVRPERIDIQPIDVKNWRDGRIQFFLKFNRIPIVGVCVNVTGFDGRERNIRLFRIRGYECKNDNDELQLIVGDLMCEGALKPYGLLWICFAVQIIHALKVLDVRPSEILWPAEWNEEKWNGRASEFWMKKLTPADLERDEPVLERLHRSSKATYCFDESRWPELVLEVRNLFTTGKSHRAAEEMKDFRILDLLSPAVVEILQIALETDQKAASSVG